MTEHPTSVPADQPADQPDDRSAEARAEAPAGAPDAATEMFRGALRQVLVFLALLAVVSVVVGALVAGGPGVWGAVLGVAVAVVFSGTTVWSMWRSSGMPPATLVSLVAFSWLGKMLVLFVAVAVLRQFDFYSAPVFGWVAIAGAVGSAVIDLLAVRRARIPYVQTD
ncbi:hypothetical protein [Cellulomonas sp. PhB143]|uniref:hypothetical protein n=1 Tax=Cellulomonas sp. PhB143 TaxID=2485186 RepID=UPI000F992BCF|nr:hypothetical protein [Cellulomonas sp. PhB143]ROS78473.1 hypothetical protein EDF32_0369 [Cellulomonas sp. PhB143]